MMSDQHAHAEEHGHGGHHGVDNKVIGIQYAVTALCFLFFGFCLVSLMRWQLAFPNQPIPILGGLLASNMVDAEGRMLPEFYNALGAMHGTIMVFLGVVPLAVGGFGNFVMPLQIGAPDMAFPKLNMMSYWVFFVGGVIMLGSFFLKEGPAQSGWTSYPP
ncbi:cbb3-type cytochrome c oxidase subunit I, partial [Candidatus Sumerlaeota bacterium]|nr:cbb3-type cytochrome c oxidase subunit I [Candidatus Sumerlaeota bacterium]